MSGISRAEASNSSVPFACTNDCSRSLQKFLNTATRQLLYEFHVSGHIEHPKITTVPAPILTTTAANLFNVMLRGTRADKLGDAIQENRSTGDATVPVPAKANSADDDD